MRRAVMGALILVIVLPCSSAMACSIVIQSPRERVHAASLAVWVEVLRVDQIGVTPSGATRWEATVRRLRTFKGRPSLVFRVWSTTDSGTCGLPMFEAGRRVGLLMAGPGPPFAIGAGSIISLADLRRARR
jgi:hypothetical protein